jgi:biotin synthase-like enzyme
MKYAVFADCDWCKQSTNTDRMLLCEDRGEIDEICGECVKRTAKKTGAPDIKRISSNRLVFTFLNQRPEGFLR